MECVSTLPIFMLKLVALPLRVRVIWVQISVMRPTVLTRFFCDFSWVPLSKWWYSISEYDTKALSRILSTSLLTNYLPIAVICTFYNSRHRWIAHKWARWKYVSVRNEVSPRVEYRSCYDIGSFFYSLSLPCYVFIRRRIWYVDMHGS